MRQAVILAGGKGTRLRERLGGRPKPLVDICGVPLLEHQVSLVKRHCFNSVLILVNHAAEQIVHFCAQKSNWNLAIELVDDGTPRGTAGATLAAYDRLAEEFLIIYGDTMLEVDLTRFHARHSQAPAAAATLLLHPNDHPHDSDLVEMDNDGCIRAFHPYPHEFARNYPNLVNAALYWVNKRALLPWRDEPGPLDFAKELFPAMLRRGLTLKGYRSPEYIKDVGTPTRLEQVCCDVRSGKVTRGSLDRPQAMVFMDRDGTINREVDHLANEEQFQLLPGVGASIRRLNASEYRCCVVTNQPVVARGECTEEGLRKIHNKMETLLGREGAYVDGIYYCPHHPHGGYPGERPELKVDCGCRKPKTGLIDRAVADFNVERGRSWMVGDTSVDSEMARRAGLRSILVETGCAGLDYRFWALPDIVVPDLTEAVSFILDRYPLLLSLCSEFAAGIGEGAVVLVGGQSRSGKSTFASVLCDALRARGRMAKVLAADRWLRNEAEREPGVLGRYDMAALQRVVDHLTSRTARAELLLLPAYHKLRRERVESVEQLPVAASDVVVIEGTVALALTTPASVETHRYHVEIAEEERRERVLKEYRLRGMERTQAAQIYASRKVDEFPVVANLGRISVAVSLT